MDITREYLEQHKAELGQTMAQLRQHLARTQAQIHGAEGAILACDHLLARLAEPEPAPPRPAPEKGGRSSRPRKT